MANQLEKFLEKQINSGNIDWESKSKLILSSDEQVNGHTARILKKFEHKFNFSIDFIADYPISEGGCPDE